MIQEYIITLEFPHVEDFLIDLLLEHLVVAKNSFDLWKSVTAWAFFIMKSSEALYFSMALIASFLASTSYIFAFAISSSIFLFSEAQLALALTRSTFTSESPFFATSAF